jgi:hypothetical protein
MKNFTMQFNEVVDFLIRKTGLNKEEIYQLSYPRFLELFEFHYRFSSTEPDIDALKKFPNVTYEKIVLHN